MNNYFRGNSILVEGAEFTYHSSSFKGRAKQFVERHINNTEPEFFFLPSTKHAEIKEDLLVFLRLTIALRKEHYDVLTQAKIAELADVFQAKLGWLKGDIYSRVATPDSEELSEDPSTVKQDFYDRYVLQNHLVWLSGFQSELLRKIVKERRQKYKRDLTRDCIHNNPWPQ